MFLPFKRRKREGECSASFLFTAYPHFTTMRGNSFSCDRQADPATGRRALCSGTPIKPLKNQILLFGEPLGSHHCELQLRRDHSASPQRVLSQNWVRNTRRVENKFWDRDSDHAGDAWSSSANNFEPQANSSFPHGYKRKPNVCKKSVKNARTICIGAIDFLNEASPRAERRV